MRNFKTLAAAIALVSAIGSAPSFARVCGCGYPNGLALNGLTVNGLALNGHKTNGTRAQTMSVSAVTLPKGRVVKLSK